MKKGFIKLFLCLLAIVLVQGCSSTFSDKKAPQVEQKKEVLAPSDLTKCKDADQAGQVMVEGVTNGLDSGNYEMYTKDFTDESQKSFTSEIFKDAHHAVDANLGKIKAKQYLGSYQKNGYWVLLWKAKYSKTNEDVLLELYVKKVGNTYKIAAFIPK